MTPHEIRSVFKLKDEMSTKLNLINKNLGGAKKNLAVVQKSTGGLGRAFTQAVGPMGRMPPALSGVTSSLGAANAAILPVIGSIALLAGGMIKWTKDITQLGTKLVDLSASTSLSLKELQELGFASKQVGVDMKSLTDVVLRLQRRAAAGLPETTRFLGEIGVSVQEIIRQRPADAFLQVVGAIKQLETPAQQAAAAMGIFGDQGLKILPLIRSDIALTIDEFNRLGGVIDDEVLEAGKRLDDQMTSLSATFTAFTAILAGETIPPLAETATLFTQLVKLTTGLPIKNLTGDFVSLSLHLWGVADSLETINNFLGLIDKRGVVATVAPPPILPTAGPAPLGAVGPQGEELLKFYKTQTKEMAKAQKAAEALQRPIIALAQSLGTGGLLTTMEQMNAALELVNSSSNRLSSEGLMKVLQTIDKLNAEGITLTGRLAEIDAAFKAFGEGALATLPELVAPTIDWDEALKGVGGQLDEINSQMPNLDDYPQAIGGIVTSTMDWSAVQSNVNDFLSETRGLMTLLGIEADTVFGKIIGWLTKIFDAFNALTGIINKVLGLFGGGFGGIGDIFGSLFGGKKGVPGVMAGVGDLGLGAAGTAAGTSFLGSFGSAVGGGLKSLASTLAPLFTNPFTIAIGAGIAGFFAIKGLFGGKDEWEKVAEEVARDFGVSLSEALNKQIGELAEQVGDRRTAIALSLGDIFRETDLLGNVDLAVEKMADVFVLLGEGQITAAQAQSVLNDTVAQLIPVLDQLGPAGEEQLQRLISAAKEFGLEIEGIGALIQSQFAPSTIQELRAEFGLTREEVNALAEATGVKIQTNIQRMAAEAGLTTKQFKELRDTAAEHGIELEKIDDLAAAFGITVADLAKAWEVNLGSATKATSDAFPAAAEHVGDAASEAARLADELFRAARAAGQIHIPASSGTPGVNAAQGLDAVFSSPTTLRVGEGFRPERVLVQPLTGASSSPTTTASVGPVSFAPTIVITGGSSQEMIENFKKALEEDASGLTGMLIKRLKTLGAIPR